MRNKLCFTSQAQVTTPDQKFHAIANAGFSGVGLRMDEIDSYLAQGYSLKDLSSLIKENRLAAIELHVLKDWLYVDGKRKNQMLKKLGKMCDYAEQLDIQYICCPSYGHGDRKKAISNLSSVCKLASNYGKLIAFEFLGWGQICTLEDSLKLIQEVKRENLGLVIDTAHFFTGGSTLDMLATTPIEKIFLVHINDLDCAYQSLSPRKRCTTTRSSRLLPGDGVLPLKPFIDIVCRKKRYLGYVCVEILNREIGSMPYEEITKLAFKKSMEL